MEPRREPWTAAGARWLDAHCHLSDPRLGTDAIARFESAGVGGFLLGGVDPVDWRRQLSLAASRSGIRTSFGLHPWAVTGDDGEALAELERLLPEAAALGETGLDASRRHRGTLAAQRDAFRAQLELAERFAKPLVLHVVGAHAEAISELRGAGPFPRGGFVHGFTGDMKTAEAYLELGLMISVGLRPCPALASLPGDSLLVESDADRPGRDLLTAARPVAEARGESVEELLDRSARNLRRLLGEHEPT